MSRAAASDRHPRHTAHTGGPHHDRHSAHPRRPRVQRHAPQPSGSAPPRGRGRHRPGRPRPPRRRPAGARGRPGGRHDADPHGDGHPAARSPSGHGLERLLPLGVHVLQPDRAGSRLPAGARPRAVLDPARPEDLRVPAAEGRPLPQRAGDEGRRRQVLPRADPGPRRAEQVVHAHPRSRARRGRRRLPGAAPPQAAVGAVPGQPRLRDDRGPGERREDRPRADRDGAVPLRGAGAELPPARPPLGQVLRARSAEGGRDPVGAGGRGGDARRQPPDRDRRHHQPGAALDAGRAARHPGHRAPRAEGLLGLRRHPAEARPAARQQEGPAGAGHAGRPGGAQPLGLLRRRHDRAGLQSLPGRPLGARGRQLPQVRPRGRQEAPGRGGIPARARARVEGP